MYIDMKQFSGYTMGGYLQHSLARYKQEFQKRHLMKRQTLGAVGGATAHKDYQSARGKK